MSYQRLLVRKVAQRYFLKLYYSTSATIDTVDILCNDLLRPHRKKVMNNPLNINDVSLRYFMKIDNNDKKIDISALSREELEMHILELLSKNKDKQFADVLTYCLEKKISISEIILKRLLRNASANGKVDAVVIIQKYISKLDPYMYKRNGEFLHYTAKAQCMKGNSEKGLTILKSCYIKFEGLRSFYRIILRELIQDSVLNRSEASIVVFKKHVLELSETYEDHYPLVCFWHNCWASTWFSDQVVADELLEVSIKLQEIVRDKATAFSTVMLQEYNDDAVVRLLQILLKYRMMNEYVKVLEILFAYKLRNRDLHGCTEIVRNCEALGLTLPVSQQGRYIKMLINNKSPDVKPITKSNFKLKF